MAVPRQEKVGKLNVGKRTWGGLVGIFGFPQLIDGGFVTAPNPSLLQLDEGVGCRESRRAP